MPNWCSNYMSITGPKEELERFKNEVHVKFTNEKGEEVESVLSFNVHVPIWDYATGKLLDKKHATNAEGTNSNLDHLYNSWGTKWDVVYGDCDLELCEDSAGNISELVYSFQTAWGPADDWFRVVVEKFPKLSFRYEFEESGCAVYGYMEGSNGETEDHPMTHEEWLEENHDCYTEYVKDIENFTQDELVKYFSGVKNFQECCDEEEEWHEELKENHDWGYSMYDLGLLAGKIIPRIEAKNLPLFVNVDWGYGDYNQIFKERLAKGE